MKTCFIGVTQYMYLCWIIDTYWELSPQHGKHKLMRTSRDSIVILCNWCCDKCIHWFSLIVSLIRKELLCRTNPCFIGLLHDTQNFGSLWCSSMCVCSLCCRLYLYCTPDHQKVKPWLISRLVFLWWILVRNYRDTSLVEKPSFFSGLESHWVSWVVFGHNRSKS